MTTNSLFCFLILVISGGAINYLGSHMSGVQAHLNAPSAQVLSSQGCDRVSLWWIQLGLDLLPSSCGRLQNSTSLQLQEWGLWLFANYGLEAAWSSEPRGPLCRPLTTWLPANSRPAKNLSLPSIPMESYTTKRSQERHPTALDSTG